MVKSLILEVADIEDLDVVKFRNVKEALQPTATTYCIVIVGQGMQFIQMELDEHGPSMV
jgi:hypothetical protein